MTVLSELTVLWAVLLLKFVLLSYLPETLGLGSASPLTDVKSPVVELLSTPPRRGRRWLTDTCSMKEVPYLRKYHHSNICGGDTFRDNTFYKNNGIEWQTFSHPFVATAMVSLDSRSSEGSANQQYMNVCLNRWTGSYVKQWEESAYLTALNEVH